MAATSESYIEQVEFHLPITTEEALRDYVECALGLHIPSRAVCKERGHANHSTPWAAFCDAYFARSTVSLWKASRGLGGKSHLLAALGTVEAQTLPRCEVALLGGSGEQAKRVHESMQEFWNVDSAPRYMLQGDPSSERTRLYNGSAVKVQMASSRSVRGPHPQRLRLDEVDEMEASIFNSAMGQPMTKHGVKANVVGASTHHYDAGLFEDLLEHAPGRGWSVHEWCIEETREANGGWVSEEMIREKQVQMSAQDWTTEVLLQRPSKGLRVFPTFDLGTHVQPCAIVPDLPIYLGIDFGFLRFAWVAFQLVGDRVQVFASDLWRSCGSIDGGRRLAAMPWAARVKRIGCDPAGNASDVRGGAAFSQVLDINRAFQRDLCLHTQMRPYASPNWRAGQLRVLLGDGAGTVRLAIDPSCEALIRGFRKLSFKEDSRDEIDKTDELDDPIDAMGYGMTAAAWLQPTTFGGTRPR